MSPINSLERVLTTIKGDLPDQVPIFPLTTTKPAQILNVSLPALYRDADLIFKGQQKFQAALNHDYVTTFFYLVKDAEPWGAKPIYYKEGAPNLGKIPFENAEQLLNEETPSPNDSDALSEPRKAIKLFAQSELKGTVPIIGILSGPFSLPTFFFDTTPWLEILLISPSLFSKTIDKLIPYTIEWANLQLELGVDAILIVDGMVTTTIIPPDIFFEHVVPVYKKLANEIKGPVILGGAGGEFQPVLAKLPETKVLGVTLSTNDDLRECKKLSNNSLTLLGNLNNIKFPDWTPEIIENEIKNCISQGTQDLTQSRYILMNQHSFPTNVSMNQIESMVKYGRKHGKY